MTQMSDASTTSQSRHWHRSPRFTRAKVALKRLFRPFSRLRDKLGLRSAARDETIAAAQPERDKAPTPEEDTSVTTPHGEVQNAAADHTAQGPSLSESVVRHGIEYGEALAPALEIIPVFGTPLKGAFELVINGLKMVDQRWQNQSEVQEIRRRLQHLRRMLLSRKSMTSACASDPEGQSSPGSSVADFEYRLRGLGDDLMSISHRQGVDYAHIAGDIQGIRKRLEDAISECVLLKAIETGDKLSSLLRERKLGAIKFTVVDPFGTCRPFYAFPESTSDLAKWILTQLTHTNTEMGKAVQQYVDSGQYDFRRDRDRSGQSLTDIGALVLLPIGERIVMSVVETLDPPQDSIICPNSDCSYLIRFDEGSQRTGKIHCVACGNKIESVDRVVCPLPNRSTRLSKFFVEVVFKTTFPRRKATRTGSYPPPAPSPTSPPQLDSGPRPIVEQSFLDMARSQGYHDTVMSNSTHYTNEAVMNEPVGQGSRILFARSPRIASRGPVLREPSAAQGTSGVGTQFRAMAVA